MRSVYILVIIMVLLQGASGYDQNMFSLQEKKRKPVVGSFVEQKPREDKIKTPRNKNLGIEIKIRSDGVKGRGNEKKGDVRWVGRKVVCKNLKKGMRGRIVMKNGRENRHKCAVQLEFPQNQWDNNCPESRGKEPRLWLYNCPRGSSKYLSGGDGRFFKKASSRQSAAPATPAARKLMKDPPELDKSPGAYGNKCVINPKGRRVIAGQVRDQELIDPDNDSFIVEFLKQNEPPKLRTEAGGCLGCEETGGRVPKYRSMLLKDIIRVSIPRPKKLKRECVAAALEREIEANNRVCASNSGSPLRGKFNKMKDPCITEQMVDYVTWAFNKAVACYSTPGRPIDPRVIFKKLNNESGMQYWIQNNGGIGIGQITTPAFDEMYDEKRGKKYVIDPAIESDHPDCAPFKKVMKKKPHRDRNGNVRWCQLVSTGEGLGRSLFLSIGYYKYVRDHYPRHSARVLLGEKGVEDDGSEEYRRKLDFLSYLHYSAKGPAGARTLLSSVAVDKNTSADEFRKSISALRGAWYLRNVNKKMKEILRSIYKKQLIRENAKKPMAERMTNGDISKMVGARKFNKSELAGDICVE